MVKNGLKQQIPMNYETNLLNKALSEVYAQLQIYAQKDYFFNILEQVFGNNFDLSKAEKIRLLLAATFYLTLVMIVI